MRHTAGLAWQRVTTALARAFRDARVLTGLALVAIMVAAGALRIWALGGLEFGLGDDDAGYAAVARNLANGYLPDGESEWFGARAVFLWPVALAFRIFGANDYTAVAWPLACSLLSVLAAFLVARQLAGRRPALVAAGLVAAVPLEVLWATRLRPDAVMPAFVALAVWAALRSRRPGHATAWLLGAGALMGAAWSVRETALVMIPIVVLAAWPTLRAQWRRAAALVGGLLIVPLCEVLVFALDGRPLWPLTTTAGAGSFRSLSEGWGATTSYAQQLVTHVLDPRSPLFFMLPLVLIAIAVAIVRRRGAVVIPVAWLALGFLYLEVGTLVSVDKPLRFLTLLTVPAALLIAIALDGRLSPVLPLALAVVTVLVVQPRLASGHRSTNVVLASAVADELRGLPPGPVLSADYIWWAKLNTYLARERLTVRRAVDPAYLDPAARERAHRLEPVPDIASGRGGYVVTGPVRETSAWPSNWAATRRAIESIPRGELEPVARVGRAMIWRWAR
jgi:4-amino-4-deoxy-L-arabinose transferase-like glycosyltransferase